MPVACGDIWRLQCNQYNDVTPYLADERLNYAAVMYFIFGDVVLNVAKM
jgi:hypothetical protein